MREEKLKILFYYYLYYIFKILICVFHGVFEEQKTPYWIQFSPWGPGN